MSHRPVQKHPWNHPNQFSGAKIPPPLDKFTVASTAATSPNHCHHCCYLGIPLGWIEVPWDEGVGKVVEPVCLHRRCYSFHMFFQSFCHTLLLKLSKVPWNGGVCASLLFLFLSTCNQGFGEILGRAQR